MRRGLLSNRTVGAPAAQRSPPGEPKTGALAVIPRQVVDTEEATERRVATEGRRPTMTVLLQESRERGGALGAGAVKPGVGPLLAVAGAVVGEDALDPHPRAQAAAQTCSRAWIALAEV